MGDISAATGRAAGSYGHSRPDSSTWNSCLTIPVAPGWLFAALIAWLGGSQLLLWRFLNFAPAWAYLAGVVILGGLCAYAVKAMKPSRHGINMGTLLTCFLVALILLILSGEGRFFYANVDWQVRFAVLRDMAINPWPFVYTVRSDPDVLRAPIGMFLAPALIFKTFGHRAGDMALLLQNSMLVSLLLAAGALLFKPGRPRVVALVVILAFSGLDALGDFLVQGTLTDHLEDWAFIQYSSTVTLLFWVPQHAIAGWIGAVGYLLWRDGRMPLALWLLMLPLTALWSPLGLLGTMPFAALAGLRSLIGRTLHGRDMLLPALTTVLCLPSLLYLGAAGDDVGVRLLSIPFGQWLSFQSIETLPFLVPLAALAGSIRFGRDTLRLTAIWLMLIPFVQIGWSTDFMMRGSITALTILAVMVCDALMRAGAMRLWLIVVLGIGSITGLAEIRRALVSPPAPEVNCSFFKAWDQIFFEYPKGTYIAPLYTMPSTIRPPNPAHISNKEPDRCWNTPWPSPTDPRAAALRQKNRIK